MEISTVGKKRLNERYGSGERLVKKLVARTAAESALKNDGLLCKNISGWPSVGLVEHNIGKRAFSLQNSVIPVTKSQLESLE